MKKRNISLKIVSAIILTGMLLCSLSACSKEAKIYPYSGKIPFDEKIEFGMSISEVEAITGKLEKSESIYTDDDWRTGKRNGYLKNGGCITEKYMFNEDGQLTRKRAFVKLLLDTGNDENLYQKCEESYVSEMTRIFSEIYQKLEIKEELPDFASEYSSIRTVSTEKYDIYILAYRTYGTDGTCPGFDGGRFFEKRCSTYGGITVEISERK